MENALVKIESIKAGSIWLTKKAKQEFSKNVHATNSTISVIMHLYPSLFGMPVNLLFWLFFLFGFFLFWFWFYGCDKLVLQVLILVLLGFCFKISYMRLCYTVFLSGWCDP